MIAELKFHDVPSMSDTIRYYDGELLFADNITSVPKLMRVFKLEFIAFVFCLGGELELKLNTVPCRLKRNDALFVNASTVVDLVSRSDDFSCKVCAITPESGLTFINKSIFDAVMRVYEHPVVHLTDEEVTLVLKYYGLADFKMAHPGMSYDKESISLIVKACAYDLLACVARHMEVENQGILRQGDKLFRRFLSLLSENKDCSRSVSSFADDLCVSPKYLTTICRQHSGKTASELIALSMVGRIKQMLLYSDLSIKEISAQLGFNNLSFFGKYVKKHLGQSPNTYRRLKGYGR
ncbi:MAG: AraC family transcriptional regulator [Muribaculaceae bacterium]|nr:AraC family transcriptional regulator [Muribaculaceae bacterium]